jgi:hypothetical protein
MSWLMLNRMFAPMREPARLMTARIGTYFQTIFFAFQNLKKAVVAWPIPPNRSVAIYLGRQTKKYEKRD